MLDFQKEYNDLYKRFENGCKYITEHPEEENKWLQELTKIAERLEYLKKYF